ncbi:MAG: PTS lactose/cellobiose transporter subunit IIA [Aerococcus sp.]|nr:PTS lactose/cellobiose transporter subunit IIA [Aerococcus sp.]
MDTNDQSYELAFQVIVHAGESRTLSYQAMNEAEAYRFEEAHSLLEQANKEFLECHTIQTDMLTKEANGRKTELNIILIHAQDHLTMATMAMDTAKRWIKLQKKLKALEEAE